jgi:serine protease AprX
MSHPILARAVRCAVVTAALAGTTLPAAAAQLDAQLAQRLAQALPTDKLEVVVSYEHAGPANASELAVLSSLGITQGVRMRSLPIVGAKATPAQIRALAERDDIASVYLNRQLRYFNLESRQISSTKRAQERSQDFGRVVPFSGRGVTAMINDSGIDATHADVAYGSHVVQNVQALTNLAAWDSMLPITWLENQQNTDTNSGHGTHVAGTFGGNGARSAGQYQGVAPGADIVGYGSGAAIAILDAVGGFDYAITHQNSFPNPIRIISNSWGTSGRFDPVDPVNIASYEAYKRGMTVVFAAGNDGPGEDTHNPYAQAPWVISVGAANKAGGLASFSSRGSRFESGTFTTNDGLWWTYRNEPTVSATGVDVISTRALTNVAANGGDGDVGPIPPQYLPFYTMISGTSMATPHVAGIVALMYEANPALTPDQVRDILRRTATNLPGRDAWETGTGHVNAYAALSAATGLRTDFGTGVNALRTFNASANVSSGGTLPFSVDFTPVGTTGEQAFDVGPNTAWVNARAQVPTNTVALVLIDPDGKRYGSGITLPELGSTAAVSAPGKAGRWKITVRGIGSVSGVVLDPARLTNGVALPGNVSGDITFYDNQGYSGLDDIAGHAARGAIEYAVSRRLVDGLPGNAYQPDAQLTRGQLAEYLVMGGALRQQLPNNGTPGFTDVATGDRLYAFAEAASRRGGALKDLPHTQNPAIRLANGAFRAQDAVTHADLAYALVQQLGLQAQAASLSGPVKANYNGQLITVDDDASIPAALRGHVQIALDLNILSARFFMTQGPYDLQPKVHAVFEPTRSVSRAEYAVVAARFTDRYLP